MELTKSCVANPREIVAGELDGVRTGLEEYSLFAIRGALRTAWSSEAARIGGHKLLQKGSLFVRNLSNKK